MNDREKSKTLTEVTIKTGLLNRSTTQKNKLTRLVKILRLKHVCVSSKAALITLIWSFCIGIVCGLASNPSKYFILLKQWISSVIYIGDAISLCFYPLSGYLADNVLGRYKIITTSLKMYTIACIVTLIPVIVSVVLLAISDGVFGCDLSLRGAGEQNIGCNIGYIGLIVVSVLFYIAINISFIGFNANVIQFGMDQLHDSPSEHQSLFIYWYVWIYYIVQLIIVQPSNLAYLEPITSSTLLFMLIMCPLFMIIVSLCIARRKKNWFLINPARVNPYKLVYKITRFSRQHKAPVQRSAFTYCEDEIPTGLDLAKTKYGGPYSTEEVENVKAFYGILKILLSLCPAFLVMIAADYSLFWYSEEMAPHYLYEENLTIKIFHYFVDDNTISSIIVVLLIPVYLFFFKKCLCYYSMGMLKRIGLGITFVTMTLIIITGLIVYTHKQRCLFQSLDHRYDSFFYNGSYNSSEYIIYMNNFSHMVSNESVSFPAMLIILPRCLYGISNMFLYTALYEFICAQSPPSMKGLLIGLCFAIKGIFQAIGAILLIPLGYLQPFSPNCGLWYYGINTLISIISLIVFSYYAKRYKYRQRDEIYNIYQYAEDYYSKTEEKP